MATFRYRQLTSSRDAQAVETLRKEFGGDTIDPRRRRAARDRAEREAPLQVRADEAEASYQELVRQLREGELKPSDLVFSGGGWTTFATAPEFYEVCSEHEEAEEADGQRTTRHVLVAGAVIAVLLLWLLASC